MNTQPARDFLDLLRHSNLLSAEQLAALAQEVGPQFEDDRGSAGAGGDIPDAPQLAQRLVERGWLTRWQADALLSGQKTFFFGHYRLLERIGTGGMGSVFKARHDRLGRIVALKIMSRAFIRDAHAVARFHNEIRAVAALNHPQIVAAFDAGNVGSVHYLVMEYVPGRDLGWYVQRYGKLPIGWACECIRQAALGLQHAHEQGMVHRDVKPTNLLVTKHPETGDLLVKLLDLGLARFSDQSELPAIVAQPSRPAPAGLTQAGQVLGTPDYMSPEQARDTRAADLRSDIFSLGCTLFRLLTAEMPYPGESITDKIKARQHGTPSSLKTLRNDAHVELIAVVSRMMAHDPAARYQSAAEVAAELAPFASAAPLGSIAAPVVPHTAAPPDQPVVDAQLAQFFAHLNTRADDEVSSPARPARLDRFRAVFNLVRTRISPRTWRLAGAGLALVLAVFGLVRWLTEATLIVELLDAEREQVEFFLNDTPYPLGETSGHVRIAVRPGLWTMRLTRPGYIPLVETAELTAGEYHIWIPTWRQNADLHRNERLRTLEERAAAFVGDTSEEAAALCDDLIELRARYPGTAEAAAAGGLLARLPSGFDDLSHRPLARESIGLAGEISSLAAPATLVCVVGDPRMKCWNRVGSISFDRSGTRVAAASDDGSVHIFDATTGKQEHRLQSDGRPTLALFSPQGQRLAVADAEGGVSLWNAAIGVREGVLHNARAPLAFDGDGRRLATRGSASDVLVWDVAERTLLRKFDGRRRVVPKSLVFSPQGRSLLVCGSGRVSLLCDLTAEQPPQQLSDAGSGCFSPDGKIVAVGMRNGDARLINVDDGHVQSRLKRGGEPLAFSADGQLLISTFRVQFQTWDVASGALRQSVVAEPAQAIVSPDGMRLAAFDKLAGRLALADLPTGTESTAVCGDVESLAFTSDGKTVATGGADGCVRMFDAVSGYERRLADPPISAAAVFPHGASLVVVSGSSAEVRDLRGARPSLALAGDAAEIEDFVVSPTAAWVIGLGGADAFRVPVRFWSATSGREFAHAEERSGTVRAYAISADGKTLATAGDDAAVQIWDLAERRIDETLYGLGDRLRALSFDPQGRWLAAAGHGRELAIYEWRSKKIRRLELPVSEDLDIFAIEHELRGTHIVAATSAGTFVCETHSGASQELSAPDRVASTCAAFSPDGERLAVGSDVGKVVLWRCDGDLASLSEPANELTIGPARGLIRRVYWSSDSRHLLTHNGNGTVYVLKVAERRVK